MFNRYVRSDRDPEGLPRSSAGMPGPSTADGRPGLQWQMTGGIEIEDRSVASESPEGQGLFSFRIEFSIQCPRCDGHIPVNGPMEEVRCPGCRSVIEVPREYWTDTLGASCRKMTQMEKGGGTGSILMGTFRGNRSLARFDPYCDRCKTDFEDPWHLAPGTVYRCRQCGAGYPVAAPPAWLSGGVPGIRLLINALLEPEEHREEDAPEPVTFSCPSCAASLEFDGNGRILSCRYCGADVYLPDEAWSRLHSGRRKRRWFVICGHGDEE